MANIESISPQDADSVLPLSIEAGWNQNVADWRFMLGAGRGFGLKNEGGTWEASSLVLPLGQHLAWISMVLVTQSRRSGGLGTSLLKRCLDEVKANDAVAGLDATEQGRPIYLKLGFHDLYKISRWHLDGAKDVVAPPSGVAVRPFAIADLPKLPTYDRPLSGMERPTLLAHLATRQPGLAWVAETPSGKLAGFALGREGRNADSIGPVIADNEAVGLALISKAMAAAKGPFIMDAPEVHGAVRSWLEKQGAVSPRGYMRMTLGTAKKLDDPAHVFALAGPELG
jgi:GNAT superfamily N-acetyltransferase